MNVSLENKDKVNALLTVKLEKATSATKCRCPASARVWCLPAW